MEVIEFIKKEQNKLNETTLTLLPKNLRLIKYDLNQQGIGRLTLVGNKGTYSITCYKYPKYQMICDYWRHDSDKNYLISNQEIETLENLMTNLLELTILVK